MKIARQPESTDAALCPIGGAKLELSLFAVVGAIIYKQIPDIPAIIGMVLIIVGVAVIHLFLKTVRH